MRLFVHSAALAVCCWASPLHSAEPLTVILVGEAPFQAELSTVDARGVMHLSAAGEARQAPLRDVVLWGAFSPAKSAPQLLLSDGGLLVADVLALKNDALEIDAPLFGSALVPLERVAGIVFHPPADPLRADLLAARLTTATGDADRVVLENGDELTGAVKTLTETVLGLQTSAGPLALELDRVAAVGFNPQLVDRSKPRGDRVLVGFADGSRLLAARLEVGESVAALDVLEGVTWRAARSELRAIQPLGGPAVFVSDLKPAGYQHVPFLNLSWDYKADRNVLGGHLRHGGRLYPKGIGMHSAARLTYKLDRPWRRFAAEVALDDSSGRSGSVVFRVFVDKQQRYASPIVRGGDPALPVEVDVSGGKTVSLLVDFAERGDELDHADWLNARLEP